MCVFYPFMHVQPHSASDLAARHWELSGSGPAGALGALPRRAGAAPATSGPCAGEAAPEDGWFFHGHGEPHSWMVYGKSIRFHQLLVDDDWGYKLLQIFQENTRCCHLFNPFWFQLHHCWKHFTMVSWILYRIIVDCWIVVLAVTDSRSGLLDNRSIIGIIVYYCIRLSTSSVGSSAIHRLLDISGGIAILDNWALFRLFRLVAG